VIGVPNGTGKRVPGHPAGRLRGTVHRHGI